MSQVAVARRDAPRAADDFSGVEAIPFMQGEEARR
jgi:hypothetical protein